MGNYYKEFPLTAGGMQKSVGPQSLEMRCILF